MAQVGAMTPAQDKPAPPPRRLLPPLATALVGLVFAALFCVSALMDLRRLETLLLAALQHRALALATALEKAVQENLHYWHPGPGGPTVPAGAGYLGTDEDLALREALAQALLEVARTIDVLAQAGQLTPERLAEIARTEQLQGIQLVAADGRVSLQTGEGLAALAAAVAPLLHGQEEVSLQLMENARPESARSFLALRRAAGGAVVLVLDQNGLTFWQERTAVQAAIRDFPWSADLAYFLLATPTGHLLAQIGSPPAQPLTPCRLLTAPPPGREPQTSLCTLTNGGRVLELNIPFQAGQSSLGTARLGLLTQETDALLQENRRHIFLWTGIMLAIGLVAMVLIYRIQDHYLSRLQAMRERLLQAERLSSLGKLAAGVAHEIRNPLNAIGIAIQRLQREFLPAAEDRRPNFAQLTGIIRAEVSRLNTIVEEFLNLGRGGRLDLQPVAPIALLEKVKALFQAEAQTRGVQINIEVADACPPAALDLPKMQQVLVNLVKNALEALAGPGQIRLAAKPVGPDYVQLTVSDTGPGLTPAEAAQIFDHHYTTKERGLGLGLAIAHEIIQAHGGQITVQSQPGAGTTFTLLLPQQR